MFQPWPVWVSNPSQDFSSISMMYHSATPCLVRRSRTCAVALPVEDDRFVGGQQWDAGEFEVVFDLGALVGVAGNAVDRLAHDHVEAAVRCGRLGDQVVEAAVAGNADVVLAPRGAAAALGEFLARGLDVVEVRGDDHVGEESALAVGELPGQGQCGVLLLVGGGAAEERDPDDTLRCDGGGGT